MKSPTSIQSATSGNPCPKCQSNVPISLKDCPVCGRQFGYPNVRMAERPSEVEALDRRVADARSSADANGCGALLDAFIGAASRSQAVMNRRLGTLSAWVNDKNPQFMSYYHQIDAGRQPDGSEWDEQRVAAEGAINPYCFRELNYAALSLDGQGMTYYGEYSVVLKEVTIEDRASVFEENPFLFNERHHVVAGKSPPVGYRSPWPGRGLVAGAKLFNKLNAGTTPAGFPEILMDSRRGESACDFVEVHIYGPVNWVGVDMVRGPKPERRADRMIWTQAARKLRNAGATVEEIS